jgi:hypothetical protein
VPAGVVAGGAPGVVGAEALGGMWAAFCVALGAANDSSAQELREQGLCPVEGGEHSKDRIGEFES